MKSSMDKLIVYHWKWFGNLVVDLSLNEMARRGTVNYSEFSAEAVISKSLLIYI